MKTIRKLAAAALVALAAAFVIPTAAVTSAAQYKSLVEISRVGKNLAIEPTVVFEADSEEDIAAVAAAAVKPAVTILDVNDKMSVSLGGGWKPFSEVFESLKGKSIPALRIDSAAEAEAFVAYMKDTYFIQDIMVVSKNAELLETVYSDEICYQVNSVYDLTDKTLPANRYDFWPYLADANAAGCNIVLVNGADANVSTVASYCASLSKVCWGKVAGKTEAVGAVAGGCYGIAGGDLSALQDGIKLFSKDGFARAQFVAAHRGITAYANENSLTALAAAANEGATHVEVDLQVTSDGRIVLCHNSDAGVSSSAPEQTWVATKTLTQLQKYTLNDYSAQYKETFPTLEEVIETLLDTDVIYIFELKLDNGSKLAVDEKKAIQKMYSIISKYEKMAGRWMTITFFAPYARQMKEICPEIPVGFLGFGNADNGEIWEGKPATEDEEKIENITGFIPFLRKHNLMMDIQVGQETYAMAQAYLARGYAVNTWTFSDTAHFLGGVNIATTDAAEDCAFLVKEVCPAGTAQVTAAELAAGKAKFTCRTYNGWTYEYNCDILLVGEDLNDDGSVAAVLYYKQEGDTAYGIYSNLVKLTVSAA